MAYAAPVAAGVGAVGGMYYLRKYFKGGVCTSKARLDGKTVIITGSNTGIGKETAKDLAARGARVILACRDLEKASKAAEEVKLSSKNENVVVKKLDLSSLQSVRDFAKEIQTEESRLDILINNAGVMACPHMKTQDGYELQLGVNHLGHFLLTNLLLDLLKKSSPSRIINVSSKAHENGKINFDDINSEKGYSKFSAYSQSKLANVLFTRELSRKLEGTGVTVNSLHPGVVKTELGRHFGKLALFAMNVMAYIVLKDPVDGAQTSIHCAVDEGLKDVTGLYFSDCVPKEPTLPAKSDEIAERLWKVSAELVGLEE
ncbi:retinol dehydrogenase 13-like [Ptychodera flava]|uniref:retinol dehydrogenase 13-like n=1 Tax=Ptychodera flava TaxID=63121 RepID=UPI00396A894F